MHPNVKSLIGKTFGRLLVVGTAPRPEGSKGRGQHWECICECLESLVVRSDSLVQGKSTCCGCSSPQTALMRSYIRPRHPKSTVSVHTHTACTESSHTTLLNMTEKKSASSDTVAVKREELEAMRNTLANVGPGTLLNANNGVKGALDRILNDAPRASYANENDKPRTVKGETLTEQALRIASTGSVTITGDIKLSGDIKACSQDEQPARYTGLSFKPATVDLTERKHSHYFKKCPYDEVDIYRILELFNITDQKLGHAIKKLLVAGGRGAGKDIGTDIKEAIDTLQRWQEMRHEDENAAVLSERGCA